jgi:esterase/lipase superfamily enzyme
MRMAPPERKRFNAFDLVELDTDGMLTRHGSRVHTADLAQHIPALIRTPPATTDIFVYVHGWRNTTEQALDGARALFGGIVERAAERAGQYPGLHRFQPYFVIVRWPSESDVLPDGYRRIRDRAHAMTSTGHAAHVLGALLGYVDAKRERPIGPGTMQTADGQYLHCIAHSFGGRMLAEAITWAAAPPEPPTMGWPWPSTHPFTVDTLVVFQMAAPPDVFTTHFTSLVDGDAPITGPVVLTRSTHDRALADWHRIPEGVAGIGAIGATDRPSITLHRVDEPYARADFGRVTNVDASWRFSGHSDIWHPESMHLVLSLASLSRPNGRPQSSGRTTE